ncbi:MAG: Rho termination factor N-terminal domain-containing protein [Caldimicrobium sp.]|nr:Rho termination factor N-terminal domain-containing protein [Caldimicrobium sp.]MCX7874398.1 Rho termination factor N-terminal domain-containing protein [Caldimicrobium sp.]MDW8094016.1 Rho termination factor N-terminal domain-containing protein [Caldimicrobium sp.]
MEEKATLPKLEKKLEKMTIKELRDIALQIPEISGVHGMNKEELISALKKVYGIKEEPKKIGGSIREIKAKIKKFKALAEEARRNNDLIKYERFRRLAKAFKKKSRRLAQLSKA